MNERIKELAEQADLYARSDNSSMAFDSWKNRYTEKFAELIVQECLDVVAGHCGGDPNSEPVKIFLDIEKHFGVKE